MSTNDSAGLETPATTDEPAYTHHVEPAEQGGLQYVRCTACGSEVIGRDGDRVVHREGCPNAEPGEVTL